MKEKLKEFFRKYLFNHKWRCAVCGRDIFEDGFVCEDCKNLLPFIEKGDYCKHCGRKTKSPENYCLTCKNVLTETDLMRSVFNYEDVIVKLISDFKFKRAEYLKDFFSDELYKLFVKENIECDFITFVPMTKESVKKRGYNQTELLANELSIKTGISVKNVLIKTKDTLHQVGLKRKERFDNLNGSIKLVNRKEVKDKTVLLIDDVTTTGATAEIISSKLKSGGAKRVILLSVASVAFIKD